MTLLSINARFQEMGAQIQQLEANMGARMNEMENRVIARMDHVYVNL